MSSFIIFVAKIFSYFPIVLTAVTNVFDILINNNLIIFSMCVVVLFFIIDYQFEIIGLLPRILGFSGEQEKEFVTRTSTQSISGIDKNTGIRTTHSITKTKRKRV